LTIGSCSIAFGESAAVWSKRASENAGPRVLLLKIWLRSTASPYDRKSLVIS
jgi:hypothetical protein